MPFFTPSRSNSVMHGYVRNTDGSFVSIDDPGASQTGNSLGTNISHINAAGAVVGIYFDSFRAKHDFARE